MTLFRRSLKNLLKHEEGQTVVEFALAIPIIVMLLVFIIQLIVIGYVKVIITNAAIEASRSACVTPDDASRLLAIQEGAQAGYAKKVARSRCAGLAGGDKIEPTVEEVSLGQGKGIKVTINYKLKTFPPFSAITKEIELKGVGMSAEGDI